MPREALSAYFCATSATELLPLSIERAIVAGWTGRDAVAVEQHIAELEALGVRRPASVPVFYRVSAARITTAGSIEVVGDHSSGEVEFLLLQAHGHLWVGVGSDHTDRKVETYDVAVSKQMCEKPVAASFWAFADVAAHWERLILRSHLWERGEPQLYQEGPTAAMLEPQELIERFANGLALQEGTLMFCGTLAAHGGVRGGERFSFELNDPVLGRSIRHEYRTIEVPWAS